MRSCRRQTAFRVIAVVASRQALPTKYMESCRSERGDVTGVPVYALSAGGGEGGLTGAAVGRVMIRKIGSFCIASMKPYTRQCRQSEEDLSGDCSTSVASEFVADPRAYLGEQLSQFSGR